MLLYPLVIDSPCSYPIDALMQQTTLPAELHSLLSLYLHRESDYSNLEGQGRRVIDLFYMYLSS